MREDGQSPLLPDRDGTSADLARDVARNPGNLLAHVQRVHRWIDAGDPGETWAAVFDLFVALGPRGAALRKRMLRAAGPTLTREHLQFLAATLPSGLDGAQPHPPAPGSMLSHADKPAASLAASAQADTAAAADPLNEADECLARGDIDAARGILEAALPAEPARPDLAGALLDIYRYTGDAAGLRAMRARLGRNLRTAGVWDMVERDIVLSQDDGR